MTMMSVRSWNTSLWPPSWWPPGMERYTVPSNTDSAKWDHVRPSTEELSETMESGKLTDKRSHQGLPKPSINWTILLSSSTNYTDHYGVIWYNNKWTESFLDSRQQAVVMEGTPVRLCQCTIWSATGIGVGPALCLVYIKDLPDQLTLCRQHCCLHADNIQPWPWPATTWLPTTRNSGSRAWLWSFIQ